MVTRDDKLQIFENFQTDPRFVGEDESTSDTSNRFNFERGVLSFEREEEVRLVDYMQYLHDHEKSLKSWIKLKLALLISKKKKIKKIRYESVDEFFLNIKSSIRKLEISQESVKFYVDAIEKAKEHGQIALLEILKNKQEGIFSELKLLKHGVEIYVSEEDVVKFFKASNLTDRTLKLTWIKNYIRVIPNEVIEKKEKFDNFKVFDNYVILHFDEKGNSTEMTAKEKEKAKDPILFGVCKHSRKLFYVADWIDEYCDLTLEKMLSTLEMEARKLTQETVEKQL